ncbi:hypothetical protein LIA77_00355 [Sarocladium implicatum]|nr:hypothetical protein LIA77_00355 [Sarocladium implicatum]
MLSSGNIGSQRLDHHVCASPAITGFTFSQDSLGYPATYCQGLMIQRIRGLPSQTQAFPFKGAGRVGSQPYFGMALVSQRHIAHVPRILSGGERRTGHLHAKQVKSRDLRA